MATTPTGAMEAERGALARSDESHPYAFTYGATLAASGPRALGFAAVEVVQRDRRAALCRNRLPSPALAVP